MHRSSPLLPTLATALLLVALPGGLHAQAMDKMSKETKPAMAAMKDSSTMTKDGMAKDAMHDPAKKGTKPRAGTKATGTMAEPAKMSHP